MTTESPEARGARPAVPPAPSPRRHQPPLLDERRGRRAALPALPATAATGSIRRRRVARRACRRTSPSRRCRARPRCTRSPSTTSRGTRGSTRRTSSPSSSCPSRKGLRLTTDIIGCAPDDVAIGMPLQVTFEHYEDVWLPFFEPAPMSDRHERERRHQRHRPVRRRPAPVPRSARPHARRVPRGDRRRRAHARRHRRHRHLPGRDGHAARLLRRRRHRRARRAAPEPQLVRRRPRVARPARLGRQRVHGGRHRAGQPRPVLPHGVGRQRAGRQGTLRGDARHRRRRAEAGCRASAASCSGRCRTARRRPRTGSR